MRKQKYGRIANLASSECFIVASRNLHYISSKMGVIGLTRALATEVANDNIIVNAIVPGLTDTDTVRKERRRIFEVPPANAGHPPPPRATG